MTRWAKMNTRPRFPIPRVAPLSDKRFATLSPVAVSPRCAPASTRKAHPCNPYTIFPSFHSIRRHSPATRQLNSTAITRASARILS